MLPESPYDQNCASSLGGAPNYPDENCLVGPGSFFFFLLCFALLLNGNQKATMALSRGYWGQKGSLALIILNFFIENRDGKDPVGA